MHAEMLKALLIHASYVGAAATVGVAAGDAWLMVLLLALYIYARAVSL